MNSRVAAFAAPTVSATTHPIPHLDDRDRDRDPHDGSECDNTVVDELVDVVCQRARQRPGEVELVVGTVIDELVPLAPDAVRSLVTRRAIARLDGLDSLQEWLDRSDVDEVMVNAGGDVWVDRAGSLERVATLPDGAVDVVLERVLAHTSTRLDRSNPIVDARLTDGSRVCAIAAPIAVDGTTVTIRRHRPRHFSCSDFASPGVTALLSDIIAARCNVLVSGATSTGKTTLLSALVGMADPSDRIVVLEDTTEIVLGAANCVRLQARHAIADGPAAVDLADLVRAALRLRPDRLVVGEFRGGEVLAVVQALNTGHDGSLSTCHANGATDALARVETLVMQAAPSWPLAAIRAQVSRSIDVVVHVARTADGRRRVVEVGEVIESDGPPSVRCLAAGEHLVDRFERSRA